jgi:hypothetical protein
VIFAAAFNGYLQRVRARVGVAVGLGACAAIGAASSKAWKADAPVWVIQAIFIGVCVYAVAAMLMKPVNTAGGKPKISPWVQTPVAGFGVGILTTMTGLGGGVVMVPWLTRGLRLPMSNAVPTSVIAVLFSALAALFFQREAAFEGVHPADLVALALGTVTSAALSRRVLTQIPAAQAEKVRRYAFIVVVAFSILSVALRK